MSRRSPEQILSVLEEQALEDEVREIAKMSDADLDNELRRAGVDLEAALKSAPPAPGAPLPVATSSTSRTPPRHRLRRSAAWAGGAAAAAVLVIAFALKRVEGPVGHGLDPAREASKLRDQAFAACDRAEWERCRAKLDEARSLDPPGELSPRVLLARRAVKSALQPDGSTSTNPRLPGQ
jgi:hypothetical protein